MPAHQHKSGSLKQTNKKHGGVHASKRSLKQAQGGKVNASAVKSSGGGGGSKSGAAAGPMAGGGATVSALAAGSKTARLLATKQARQQKKSREWIERRTGTRLGAPAVVLILPFGPTADVASVAASLRSAADRSSTNGAKDTGAGAGNNGAFVGVYEKHKARLQVTGLSHGASPLELLNACKSADVIIAVLSAAGGPDGAVDDVGLKQAALLRAHGVPAAVGYLQHLTALQGSVSPKATAEFKRRAATFMTDEFGAHSKVAPPSSSSSSHALGTAPFSLNPLGGGMTAAGASFTAHTGAPGEDVSSLLRAVCEVPLRPLGWRDSRGHFLAESMQLLTEPTLGNPALGLSSSRLSLPGAAAQAPILSVSGYLRGAPLNVHQLVHVPGLGARRILRVLAPEDPCPAKVLHRAAAQAAASVRSLSGAYGDAVLLCASDPSRVEPVEMSASPDMFNGEQTWPDPSEYTGPQGGGAEDGEGMGRNKPAGVSDYQAAWMGEDGQEDDGEGSDGEMEEEGGGGGMSLGSVEGMAAMRRLGSEGAADGGSEEEEEEEEDPNMFAFLQDKNLTVDGLDSAMTEEEAAAEREELKKRRAAEEMDFPDEVDCPVDMPAKERFARYRALESFRSSPWDPKESLPRAYSRIFDLGDFKVTQRRVLAADSLAAQKAQQFSLLTAAKHSTAQTAPQAALSAANDNATAAFTLPGAPEDDEEGMNGGDEEETGRGLGRRGWVGSGAYVTLQLAPKEDFRKPAGDAGEAAAAHVAVTFAEDAAAFGGLLQAHEGSASPVSFYALHRHENRLTVLHTNVQRASPLFLDDDATVASKEPMWMVCGFRHFPCRPIFSQNTLNCDKHRYERFLQGGAGNFVVASVYGPATFTPAPVLLLREPPSSGSGLSASSGFPGAAAAAASATSSALSSPSPALELVASGTLGSADVDRVVLKRVVCTGYPVRVHKRTAIVKHMFYQPADVAWFKPCGLYTKHGLSGHITGSVGTHGLFRVHFGRAIMGHDTVCLPLYKRVFPKYYAPAHPRGASAIALTDSSQQNDDDDGSAALTLPVL